MTPVPVNTSQLASANELTTKLKDAKELLASIIRISFFGYLVTLDASTPPRGIWHQLPKDPEQIVVSISSTGVRCT